MRMNKFIQLASATAAAAVLASGNAFAFSDDEARRAIIDVRQNVEKLANDLRASQAAQIQLLTEINSLKEQNRQLTGRIEELANQLSVEQRSTRDLYGSLDQRISKFEPVSVTIDGHMYMVDPKEKASYEDALGLMQSGKSREAAQKLARFIEVWADSPYREGALYWLGTSLFSIEEYKQAIASQDKLIREYPKSSRVPDSMLLVASSQASAGSTKAAAGTLQKIIKNHPGTPQAETAKARLKDIQKTSKKK